MPTGLSGGVSQQLQILFNAGALGDIADAALLRRFVTSRDEAAFEALVNRHGPMVFRVCRASLADAHDAADAFQAVFLILVRRAGSVRSQASIASWLYGVALRVSAHVRVNAARRRKKERNAAATTLAIVPEPSEEPMDATPILHEELARLPGRYREVLVLCYLEGNTSLDAARRLGRPVGTVKAQLSRGRAILKQRLLRRGIVPAAGLIAVGETGRVAAAQLPQALVSATVSSASRFGAGTALASWQVVILTQGVLRSMLIHKLTLAVPSSVLAVLAIAALALAGEALTSRDDPPAQAPVAVGLAGADDSVRPALKEAVPAGIEAADPYSMTFALIRLARAQLGSGEREAGLATFRLADEVAGRVSNTHLKRLAVMRTAVARGKAGDAKPAHATLERYVHEAEGLGTEARYNLMSMVIEFQFAAGFKAEAIANLKTELAAIDAIGDKQLRDGGIYRMLTTQLSIGDYDGALRQAARYEGKQSNMRSNFLERIMRFNRATELKPTLRVVEQAREQLRDVTYPYPRALAQREIAAAFAYAGDVEAGLALAYSIGKEDSASPFAESIRIEITPALAEIARVQAKNGAVVAAKETLRSALALAQLATQRDGVFSERVRMVAAVQGEIGDVEGAKESAGLVGDDPQEKARCLVALARAYSKAGDAASARATLRDALAAASKIVARANFINDDAAGNIDRTIHEVALAQAEIGDFKGAKEAVASRGSVAWKSELLAAIAPIQARLGDFAGAVVTAGTITDPAQAATAYSSIAVQQARAGEDDAALAWANRLSNPGARAMAIVGISEGVAIRKTERGADRKAKR